MCLNEWDLPLDDWMNELNKITNEGTEWVNKKIIHEHDMIEFTLDDIGLELLITNYIRFGFWVRRTTSSFGVGNDEDRIGLVLEIGDYSFRWRLLCATYVNDYSFRWRLLCATYVNVSFSFGDRKVGSDNMLALVLEIIVLQL